MKQSNIPTVELNDQEMEALMQDADIEAAADQLRPFDEPTEDKPMSEQEAIREEDKSEDRFVVLFPQPYEWDHTEVTQLDLSGVQNLTTRDLESVDRIMERMGRNPKNKYLDTTYQKHIAMHATNMPVEFFNQLQIRDMLTITVVLYNYFLLG